MEELREGQGYLISILVRSVYANLSLSWLLKSGDKNILLTHTVRRHCMKLCPAFRQIRGWQWTLLAYVDSKLLKAPKGHILGWHSLYPFTRHWRPWHNLWHAIFCNLTKWVPRYANFKGLSRRNFSDSCCWTNDRITIWAQIGLRWKAVLFGHTLH